MIFREEIGGQRLRVRNPYYLSLVLGLALLLGGGAVEARAQDEFTLRLLPAPRGRNAESINKKGQIVVGQIGDVTPYLPAFWAGPEAIAPTILPVPPGPYSPSGFAGSINKKGQIVGSAGSLPAFWAGPDATAPTILPVPTGPFTPQGSARSINEQGKIVGHVRGRIGRMTASLPAFREGPNATAPPSRPS